MTFSLRSAAAATISLLACAFTLPGQSFVYTNDSLSPNSVTGYQVDSTGKLTPVSGSPFATHGNAGDVQIQTVNDFAANRIVATTAGNRLFVSNDTDGTISVFNISPSTGALTLVSGSPFSGTGSCSAGYSLAITPDGKTLAAGNFCSGNLQTWSVATAGGLSVLGTGKLTGCPAGGMTASLKFTWDSRYLIAGDAPCSTVEVLQLMTTGALQPVAGSPFKVSSAGGGFSVDVACNNNSVYVTGTPVGQF
ncbi:MAG: beta-propeller fold lactonase family protein, partial [Acidobacteriota bacterium]|nr:beta-propeller fold lactonase family protein [Acidobacteriota bacterium]